MIVRSVTPPFLLFEKKNECIIGSHVVHRPPPVPPSSLFRFGLVCWRVLCVGVLLPPLFVFLFVCFVGVLCVGGVLSTSNMCWRVCQCCTSNMCWRACVGIDLEHDVLACVSVLYLKHVLACVCRCCTSNMMCWRACVGVVPRTCVGVRASMCVLLPRTC